MMILALLIRQAGLVPPSALKAASSLAETFASRDFVSALFSAIIAGALMTLLTWVAHSADSDSARVMVAFLVGFLLGVPSLNHAVVSFGEMSLGILAGQGRADWADLFQNFPVAVLGNLIGGMLFVTAARTLQVRGEPA